ncbi:hypothetical protein BG015_005858 [Linnemannia schmuckeri]|uniref:Uncharacterized protein n=1 Tax=Linnemannia schmuckeri TaxID=64567 RepID=A0A9P5VCD0_9FUNG|nr:hypothetical protein BG015_005858 [Linnemannia schmuckeri]
MGKLTSLLKKKKSKGDDLSGQRTVGSTMSGSSVSVETNGIPAAPFVSVPVVAPLSLSIPTSEMTTTTELQSPFSLMDDIMDELAGTSPNTPQPSKSNNLSEDFGLAFELSRQLETGASEAKITGRHGAVPGNGVTQKIGKLEQNSAFKDNAFLQQARSGAGASATPTPPVSGGAPYRSTFGNNNTSLTTNNNQHSATTTAAGMTMNANAPSNLRRRFQTKEAEEEEEKAQAAAAKLREESKKANAQLPSDDEGSDVSSDDDSDDEQRAFRKQQRLLAQQQHQHQLFLQQQQILQQQLAGAKGEMVEGQGEGEEEKKPVAINHEAVIDRMKGRHRALLQGAHAAARDEYYEDYRDDYAMIQQQQQGMISPGGGGATMAYNMQYGGMDPSMMYADDYRLQQQQQQQMYYPQGAPPHVNATTYNHPSVMNGMIPGYGYAHPPAPMPSYASGMQTPVYHHNQYYPNGGRGTPTPAMSHHIMQQQQFQQGGRSDSVVSDGSLPNSSSRRGSEQHSIVSSARVSEDSCNDAAQHQLQHQPQHSLSVVSTQKTANSDSGYSGVASDQRKRTPFDDSFEDIQTTVGFEYEKSSTTTKSKMDDVTKVIEGLSIAQAGTADKDNGGDNEDDQSSDDNKSEGSNSDSDSEQDEDPESLKGSTMIDSIRRGHSGFKGGITTGSSPSPSAAASNNGSNEHENDNDNDNDSSDDDDQPIILSRRSSARSPFLPASAAAASTGMKVSAEEAVMMAAPLAMQQVPVPTSNGQMQYMPTMGMYQQQPMHMSYMPPSQQQQPQQVQQQSSPQQQAYVPMGYQFPGPQPGPMGHHHSYSVDRAMPLPSMVAHSPLTRRVGSKGHTSTGSAGSAIQSQYPIPATTLLHPGPRRSHSARVRSQATSPINSNINPAAAQVNGQAGRGRSSIDFARLPSSGYQSMTGGPIGSPDFTSAGNGTGPYMRGYAEPLSSPPLQPQQQQQQQQQALPPHLQQHHPQMQQQMEKQQLQQGYFMSSPMGGGPMPSQYGYMMQSGVGVGVGSGGDLYSAHPHHQQQILQAGRR